MCSTSFSFGDVIWKCKTCQVGDETCVVCQACFQGGEHEGHDVSFYISRQNDGGCCDCGDESAWAASGFCHRHGKEFLPSEAVPAAILPTACSILGELFASLNAFSQELASPDTPRQSLVQLQHLAAAFQWVANTCKAFDGLCPVVSDLLCGRHEQWCANPGLAARPHGSKPMLDLLLLGDLQMRRRCPMLPRALHVLYLRLLTNADFKAAFAAAYVGSYTELAEHFCQSDQASEEALFSSQISVCSFSCGTC
jgi:hypothetical protein